MPDDDDLGEEAKPSPWDAEKINDLIKSLKSMRDEDEIEGVQVPI